MRQPLIWLSMAVVIAGLMGGACLSVGPFGVAGAHVAVPATTRTRVFQQGLELEPADTALEHNFLTVLYPTTSDTIAMPATALVTGTGVAGAHIANPDLNRVALFSSATDGSAPAGSLSYSYQPTARTLNLLFDLTPGARYRLTTSLDAGVQTVALIPDAGGTYQVSDQGVLSFVVATDGDPGGVSSQIYLPLVTTR